MKDMSTGYSILTKSTAASKENVKWDDGNEYPLIKMEISSDSHPFYTGKMKLVDTAGRIDKFKNKYAKFSKQAQVSKYSKTPILINWGFLFINYLQNKKP